MKGTKINKKHKKLIKRIVKEIKRNDKTCGDNKK